MRYALNPTESQEKDKIRVVATITLQMFALNNFIFHINIGLTTSK